MKRAEDINQEMNKEEQKKA